jgi:TRAP transporter TAXI family solute receptor
MTRRRIALLSAAVAIAVAAVWIAMGLLIPPPPSRIVIAAGAKGGAYEYFANRYKEILARAHVIVDVRTTEGTGENLTLLENASSGVQAGFVQGGYSNSTKSPGIESLGQVNHLGFFIFHRAGEKFSDLTSLRGKRIAVGPSASGTRVVAEKVLKANGVTADNSVFLPLSGRAAVDALDFGQVDILFLGSVLEAPLIQGLLRDPGLTLMSIPRAKALIRKFPFLSRLELPAGVIDLERNIPATDVTLLGSASSLLVRDNLHPEIVGLLAKALQEVHADATIFQHYGEFPTRADPDYPMAESALDYYKSGPSLLNRYLPFWAATYARRFLAIMVTALAIAVPVLSAAPKIYLWLLRRRIVLLYRRLRAIDARLRDDGWRVGPEEARRDLLAELEEIDLAAGKLPQRHSDLFFELRLQIDLTKNRLIGGRDAAMLPNAA